MSVRVPKAGDVPISGNGPAGDLLVRVMVAPSKSFTRQGSHLYHEARVPVHIALLGGKVRVPTLNGDVEVRIPGGTQQGEEMVLRGRGVPLPFSREKGDLFVTFSVVLPRRVYLFYHKGVQLIFQTGHLHNVNGIFCNSTQTKSMAQLTRRRRRRMSRKVILIMVRKPLLIIRRRQVAGCLVSGRISESSLVFDFFPLACPLVGNES